MITMDKANILTFPLVKTATISPDIAAISEPLLAYAIPPNPSAGTKGNITLTISVANGTNTKAICLFLESTIIS
jgi:hypothetical protein